MSFFYVFIPCLYFMSFFHVFISCLACMSCLYVFIVCLYCMSFFLSLFLSFFLSFFFSFYTSFLSSLSFLLSFFNPPSPPIHTHTHTHRTLCTRLLHVAGNASVSSHHLHLNSKRGCWLVWTMATCTQHLTCLSWLIISSWLLACWRLPMPGRQRWCYSGKASTALSRMKWSRWRHYCSKGRRTFFLRGNVIWRRSRKRLLTQRRKEIWRR